MSAPTILVVGAAIVDDFDLPRTLLSARRSSPPDLAGLWEFPGGKVEPDEDPVAALHREIREELGVEVELGAEIPGPVAWGAGAYGAPIGSAWPLREEDPPALVMRLWLARVSAGEPEPREDHDALRILKPGQWRDVDWIPADVPIVDALIDYAVRKHRATWC